MDIRSGLDVTLMHRQAEHAERAAEQRDARQREHTQSPPVKFGDAVTHKDKTPDFVQLDPAATADPTSQKNTPQHLLDLIV